MKLLNIEMLLTRDVLWQILHKAWQRRLGPLGILFTLCIKCTIVFRAVFWVVLPCKMVV
jgi:hypothetical protein